MKKALTALFSAAALAAHCAPSYMASQTWVTNRINRQVFESDRFESIERAFLKYLPGLDDAWTFEDSGGTNRAYYVYQYGDYPLEGKFLIWDGVESNPTTYTNAVFGVAYHILTNAVEISLYTNVTEFTDYVYDTVETHDEYAVTNRFYETSATITPVYGTNETIYVINTNWVGDAMFVMTNEISQTPLIGYDTQITTNGYTDVVTLATNFNYVVNVTTNTTQTRTVFAVTNVFDYAWMDGNVHATQRGFFGQQYLYDTTNVVMKLLYYPCSDAKREEAMGMEVEE